MSAAGESLPEVLREATRLLAEAGVPAPAHDARALAAHVLGTAPGRLLLHDDLGEAQEVFADLLARRAARVPLQHLTGQAPFRRLMLAVGPGVFVPRPETETVAEIALGLLRGLARPLVVDLCTGSGALALALAQEHPGAVVHAVERDPVAARWAARNVEDLRLGVRVHVADATTALGDLDGCVDLVVSNPPYVPESERGTLEPEVSEHDPAAALWGGGDGLDVLRLLVVRARALLRPGGWFVAEHADTHAESAPAVLREAGFAEVSDHDDLSGRPRVVTGRRPQEDE